MSNVSFCFNSSKFRDMDREMCDIEHGLKSGTGA